jgi:uncharacterized protein (DUF1697 family)
LFRTGTGIKKDRTLLVKESGRYTGGMRYVALLRGVNVGGKGTVDMAGLRALFEAAGMTSVTTYINSGNVIFDTDLVDRVQLAASLEEAIQERFGLKVDLLLRDTSQMRTLVEAIPAHWKNDDTMRCDVFFLWPDVDRASVLQELPPKTETEDLLYVPGAVVWRVNREYVRKSLMPKLIGTPLYKRMTMRNCNTARRLLELLERAEG